MKGKTLAITAVGVLALLLALSAPAFGAEAVDLENQNETIVDLEHNDSVTVHFESASSVDAKNDSVTLQLTLNQTENMTVWDNSIGVEITNELNVSEPEISFTETVNITDNDTMYNVSWNFTPANTDAGGAKADEFIGGYEMQVGMTGNTSSVQSSSMEVDGSGDVILGGWLQDGTNQAMGVAALVVIALVILRRRT